MSYENPVSQQAMALDDYRNSFYEQALRSAVTPESIVLDVGSGLGVLGLIAATLGAKKVYLVEPATNLEVARQIARENKLEDKIEFIPTTIERARIPEKADIISSVFTGNFLLEEDLLPSLFFARDKFLKSDGVLIPGKARMMVAPVAMPDFYGKTIDSWKETDRLVNHAVMRQFAVNHLYFDRFNGSTCNILSSPQVLSEMDFHCAASASCDAEIEFTAEQEGQLNGFLGWFDMELGGQWLSTSPWAKSTHWSQVFLPIDPVVTLGKGERIRLNVKRPEFGEWSWRCQTNGGISQHSTFLSRPFSVAELQRKSDAFQPKLGELGRVAFELLGRFKGAESTSGLAEQLYAEYPQLFETQSAAKRFVMKQIERFCDP